MALVSEQISNQDLSQSARAVSKVLEALLAAIRDERAVVRYKENGQDGIQKLLSHIKGGGEVFHSVVSADDKNTLIRILDSMNIPFAVIEDKSDKDRVIVLTRDRDAEKVKAAYTRLCSELSVGLKELSPQEFMDISKDDEVIIRKGFEEAEIDLFRIYAAEKGFAFSVVTDPDNGRYNILHLPQDGAAVDVCLAHVGYDFAGPDGEDYRRTFENSIAARNRALEMVRQNAPFVIVSKTDPATFIAFKDGRLSTHRFDLDTETDRKGNETVVVKDVECRIFMPVGKRELSDLMRELGACVLMEPEEFLLFRGLGDDHRAIPCSVTDFKPVYEATKKKLEQEKMNVWDIHTRRNYGINGGRIISYTGIETEKLGEIVSCLNEEGLSVTISGNDLAFRDDVRTREIVDGVLYRGMDVLGTTEARCYYKERGNLDFESIAEPMFIMSTREPSYVIEVNPAGFRVTKNGILQISKSSFEPDYRDTLGLILGKLGDTAVVLTQEEMKNPYMRHEIIMQRGMESENSAYKLMEQAELGEITRAISTAPDEQLNDREQAARRFVREREVETRYSDRTLAEKVVDADFGAKLHETTREDRGMNI